MDGRERGKTDEGLRLLIDLLDGDVVPPVADPLGPLTPRSLSRLARRAHRRRRRDVAGFDRLADQVGVPARRLRLLADAWGAAGHSGVRALGPALAVDPQIMARGADVVEAWRQQHYGLDALTTDVWRNRMTIRWRRPGDDPTGALLAVPLAQVRRTPDGSWHLYRRAVQGEWWPVHVSGRDQHVTLASCLEVVRIDSLALFWGDDRGGSTGPSITD